MVKNLYVGNLPPEITKEDLLENFKDVGEVVSATVIKDKFSGESKGFGFVEMATEQGAQEAINKFNGGEMSGRKIIVNEAKPRPERSNLSKSGFNKKRGRF